MDPTPSSVRGDPLETRISSCPGVRRGLFALGLLCVGLGAAGIVLPILPSTVFFLVALWAFSRSSARFHAWLYEHPHLGGPLRRWHAHRVIPLPAKIAAVATMALSLLVVSLVFAETWVLPGVLSVPLALVAAYIVTRPHRIPA